MQMVLFMGIQAAGKSTFFKDRFADTHVRINLDMLKTRHREMLLLRACFEAKQRFVVDNTNPTRADRQRYIPDAKECGFEVVGYFFETDLEAALQRNSARPEPIPERALTRTLGKLETPTASEGFDALHRVRIVGASFEVTALQS